MKAVILAGGFGSRLSEATSVIPKPMVEIGNKPIIWHIMKIYSHYGINDFVICCGYKQYIIKEYFANYYLHNSDMTVNLADNSVEVHSSHSENWKVTMVDTGLNTMTGARIMESNYIRLVIVPGAAWHFYVNDEEGMQTATQYQTEFEKGLFLMLRDYATQVPELYQVTAVTQGSIKGNDDNYAVGDWGISVVQGLY